MQNLWHNSVFSCHLLVLATTKRQITNRSEPGQSRDPPISTLTWPRPALSFLRPTLGVVKKTSLHQLSHCQLPDEGKRGPLQRVSHPDLPCWNSSWASRWRGLWDSEDYKLKMNLFCTTQWCFFSRFFFLNVLFPTENLICTTPSRLKSQLSSVGSFKRFAPSIYFVGSWVQNINASFIIWLHPHEPLLRTIIIGTV